MSNVDSSLETARSSRPILVTGLPRSGTTWVGRVIGASPSVGYIQEPFNILCRPGRCTARFPYWFYYVCEENEEQYFHHIEQTLQFRYHVWEEIQAMRTLRNAAGMARDFWRFQFNRINRRRPLLRDPFALFSAEWLARRFGFDVVVLIRHPAAFVASFKSLHWEHPFDHFLKQPLLMRDHLHAFEDEIREFAERRQSAVDQAILQWRLIHSVIIHYRDRHPEWIFRRHRDLSANPVKNFREIYERLGLPYTAHEENKTLHYCMARPKERGYAPSSVVRNSAQNLSLWRSRLTDAELERVQEKCYDLVKAFFSADEIQAIGLEPEA